MFCKAERCCKLIEIYHSACWNLVSGIWKNIMHHQLRFTKTVCFYIGNMIFCGTCMVLSSFWGMCWIIFDSNWFDFHFTLKTSTNKRIIPTNWTFYSLAEWWCKIIEIYHGACYYLVTSIWDVFFLFAGNRTMIRSRIFFVCIVSMLPYELLKDWSNLVKKFNIFSEFENAFLENGSHFFKVYIFA